MYSGAQIYSNCEESHAKKLVHEMEAGFLWGCARIVYRGPST